MFDDTMLTNEADEFMAGDEADARQRLAETARRDSQDEATGEIIRPHVVGDGAETGTEEEEGDDGSR